MFGFNLFGLLFVVLPMFVFMGIAWLAKLVVAPLRSRAVIVTILVIIMVVSLSACGGGTDDSGSTCTGAGCEVVDGALNAAANANGDGQVDVAPCNNIVC